MDIFTKPNWRGGVKDSYEYLTTIFQTDDGHEQRSAERINARRSVEFEALVNGDRLRALRGALDARSDFILNIPEPVAILARVAVYAPLGATSVQFNAPIAASMIGRRVTIQSGATAFFAQIANVTGSTVTFTAPIEREAQIGAVLRDTIICRMGKSVKVKYVTDDAAVVPMVLYQNPGEKNAVPAAAAYQSFKGREVLIEKPNWASEPEVEIVGEYEVADFDRGIIKTYSPIDFVSRITQFTYSGRSADKINRLAAFFHRQMGRLNEFYCPSWTSDLRITAPIVSGVNKITVAGREVSDFYSTSTVDRAVAILLPGGVWKFLTIASITTNGITSEITTADNINFAVALGGEIGIYWLNVCRFATDTMTVQWITDEVAQTVFQITTLEALPAEV